MLIAGTTSNPPSFAFKYWDKRHHCRPPQQQQQEELFSASISFLSLFFFTKDLVQLRSSCSSNMRTQTHTKQKRRNKYKKKQKNRRSWKQNVSHLHISAVLSYFFSLCFFFPFSFFLVFLLYFAFSTAPIVLHVYVQARSRVLKQKTREKGRNFKRTSKNRPVLGYRLVSFFFCFLLWWEIITQHVVGVCAGLVYTHIHIYCI